MEGLKLGVVDQMVFSLSHFWKVWSLIRNHFEIPFWNFVWKVLEIEVRIRQPFVLNHH